MDHILIVEDEESIARFVELELIHEGYGVEKAGDGRTGLELALSGRFDLVLLDLMLPEEDGLSVLRRLRHGAATQAVPVIILSAKDTEFDKIMGLDAGADDYLPKPFSMMELFSRIRAVLRRSAQTPQQEVYQVGALQVWPAHRKVLVDGTEVALTPKEFELLRLFISNPGLALSRGQIQDKVWGLEYLGETRTVDVHIRTLRQKLGVCGEYIGTVRGVGYRFIGSVPK